MSTNNPSEVTMASGETGAAPVLYQDESMGASLVHAGEVAPAIPQVRSRALPMDNPYTYTSMLNKWFQVKTVQLSSADSHGDIVWEDALQDLLVYQQQVLPLRAFRFFRGSVELRLTLNGNQFQQGMYYLGFMPTNNSRTRLNSQITGVRSAWFLPHQNFYVNSDDAPTLTIPFLHPLDCATNIADAANGQASLNRYFYAFIGCNVPVETSGTTSTTVDVTISMRFVEPELKILSSEITEPEALVAHGGHTSKVFNTQNIHGQSIGDATMPNNTKGDAFDTSLSVDGMDCVANTLSAVPVVNRYGSYLNNGKANLLSMEVMALNPGATNAAGPEDLASSCDEMDYESLCNREVFFTNQKWSIADAPEAQLIEFAVNPALSLYNGVGTSRPGMVDFLTTFHKFWRADAKIHIKVIGTRFASGRLLFAADYARRNSAPMSYAEAQNVYTQQVTYSEGVNEYSIDVPYQAMVPMLLCPREGKSLHGGNDRPFYSIATVALFVQNALKVAGEAPTDVTVTLSYSFHNVRFNTLRGMHGIIPTLMGSPYAALKLAPVEEEGELVAHAATSDLSHLPSNIIGQPGQPDVNIFGEDYRDLRPILRKFMKNDANPGFFRVIDKMIAIEGSSDNTLAAAIVDCFAMTRGTIRMKFYDIDGTNEMRSVFAPDGITTLSDNFSFVQLGKEYVEIEIPYYNNYRWYHNNRIVDASLWPGVPAPGVLDNDGLEGTDLYTAWGDDVRTAWFIGPGLFDVDSSIWPTA